MKKRQIKYYNITFDNNQICRTDKIRTLGVTLTDTLCWDPHICNILTKASKRLFVLRKFKDLLPRTALETIYISMIRPIIEFGDVLYDSGTLSTGQQIEYIQRQSAIICCGAYHHTSDSNLLTELGWEPLHKRRFTHKLILFYKIIHNIYPKYLFNLLNFRQLSNYNLRQTSTLQPRFTRLIITHKSFFSIYN